MKKSLIFILGLLFIGGALHAGTLANPFDDKDTGDPLTGAEITTLKNSYRTVINGNLDSANLATNAVTSDEITADSVIPSKVDEDNTTAFVMRELSITTGITSSTMTTTSTGTFAIANITTIENSPTFTYGSTASTITVTSTSTLAYTTITDVSITTGTIAGTINAVAGDPTFNSITYVDTQTRYYSIDPSAFTPTNEATPFEIAANLNLRATSVGNFYAPVNLPHGAVVTILRVHWHRNDASASGSADLKVNTAGVGSIMASADSDATSGNHDVDDNSVSNATIDNTTSSYQMFVSLDPNDNAADVRLNGVLIVYTISTPLP